MVLSTFQLATRRMLQRSVRQQLATRQFASAPEQGNKPRPFFASINGKVLYLVLPVAVIALFTALPCHSLDEIGPLDRFNWEQKKKE